MPDQEQAIALATDLYQVTMGASYFALDLQGEAVFSLFVRRLPETRNYLVAAGLADTLGKLESLRFEPSSLAYLRSLGSIRQDFIDWLPEFRFTGEVRAVPEGTIVFPNEPLLEVRAPIVQAQMVETLILNAMHYPTVVASKAARCVTAARGRSLVEFGMRRTPAIDGSVAAARAAYLAGFAGTSNVLAGQRFRIPVSGTVAHSFIELFPSEIDAFRAFTRTFPGPVTLLIDTYDTERGAHHAAQVALDLATEGFQVGAVRLDSGDLLQLSRSVRAILDAAGLNDVRILASGGLEEHDVTALVAGDAPIDAFGVGTQLGTSADAPSLDMVYKLVEYDGSPALKLSTSKETLIGPKQVWRRRDKDGRFVEDLIAAESEDAPGPDWQPLLQTVMRGGSRVTTRSLDEARAEFREQRESMPPALAAIDRTATYPVRVSDWLSQAQAAATERVRQREGLA